MRGGKGASWLVGAGVWHGFEVLSATGRPGTRGRCRGEEDPRIVSRTRLVTRTNPTPRIFPPLPPQCRPLVGAESSQGGAFSPLGWSNIGRGNGLEDEQGPGEERSSGVMVNVGW